MTKAEQRKAALAARRALSAAQRAAYSAAICERLASLPALRGAGLLLSYRALWDEVDPAALDALFPGRIVLPRCEAGRTLGLYLPRGPLVKGPFGILEPDPAASEAVAPTSLDVLLLPCLAFDARGNRLGHGAGYYDRLLPRCRNALRVCLAFEAQRLPRVLTEPHDIPAEWIVTEADSYEILLRQLYIRKNSTGLELPE